MQKVFEKIIERLEDNSMMFATSKKFWDNPQNGEYVRCAVDIETAVKIVNQVASEHGGGWIPVKERLPEELQKVLIYTDKGSYYVAKINTKGEWVSQAECVKTIIEYQKVIAWQPLPEAYKSEEE